LAAAHRVRPVAPDLGLLRGLVVKPKGRSDPPAGRPASDDANRLSLALDLLKDILNIGTNHGPSVLHILQGLNEDSNRITQGRLRVAPSLKLINDRRP